MKKVFYLIIFISFILSGCSYNLVAVKENNFKGENSDNSLINKINKYYVNTLQIGGMGSRFTQKTVYTWEDEIDHTRGVYYLEAEDYASVSFNNPADIMTASCKDGYGAVLCKSSSKNKVWLDVLTCRTEIEDKMQNRIEMECEIIKK